MCLISPLNQLKLYAGREKIGCTYCTCTIEGISEAGEDSQEHRVIVAFDGIVRLDSGQLLSPFRMLSKNFANVHDVKWIILALKSDGLEGLRQTCKSALT